MSLALDDAPVMYVEELKDGNRLVFGEYMLLGIPSWIICSAQQKYIILAKKCKPGSLLFIDEGKLGELIAFCEKARLRAL